MAPLAALLVFFLSGCGPDEAYHPHWLKRLAEKRRYDEVWHRYQSFPPRSRSNPTTRLAVLHASLASRNLDTESWPAMMALCTAGDQRHFFSVVTPWMSVTEVEQARFLSERMRAISDRFDTGAIHFLTGAVRLIATLALIHHETQPSGADGAAERLSERLAKQWIADLDHIVALRDRVRVSTGDTRPRYFGEPHRALVELAFAFRRELGMQPSREAVLVQLQPWIEGTIE